MKANYTHIAVLIDRSGSIHTIKQDMEGGFNTFLKEQQAELGECTFTIAQFDNHYEVLQDFVDVKDAAPLALHPRGGTALNDSLAKLITDTGSKLAEMKEEDRPARVQIVIITDGHENASKVFKREDVRKMIEHQQENYSWEFEYIGANVDAFSESESLGIKGVGGLSGFTAFESNERGVMDMYGTLSMKSKLTRSRAANISTEEVK